MKLDIYHFTIDYLVIVRSGYAKQVHQALQHFSLSTSKFEIFSIPDEDDTGTAEALLLIKDKIKVSHQYFYPVLLRKFCKSKPCEGLVIFPLLFWVYSSIHLIGQVE